MGEHLRETVRGWLCRSGLAISLGLAFCCAGRADAAPTVNGLFYGDGDQGRYVLYNTSIGGSKLWYTIADNRLYVALVVSRTVNDNVFGNRDYTRNAGWSPPHLANRLVDSEFAEFTLTVGAITYQWRQGYGERVGGVWLSNHTTGAGSGTPPPDYVSASSFAWNINTYEANPAPAWNLYTNGATINDWKSPFQAAAPDVVLGLEGYPATGDITYSPTYQWEWPMVYEWSVDLSSFGPAPVFVISGSSHHSPAKSGGENDPFPTPPGNGYMTDYGDLPAPYPTLLAANGARHYLVPNGARLGALADPEPDGLPHPQALGDDLSGSDDEDGVSPLTALVPGRPAVLRVTAGTAGFLSAFIDWNGDGTLTPISLVASSGPTVLPIGTIGDMELEAGVYDLTVDVPANASTFIHARFRLTNLANQGGNSPVGLAVTGEVEDYQWISSTPMSSGIDLRAYQGADGAYVEFEAHDVEEDGTVRLYLLNEDGSVAWSGTAVVQAGPRHFCRFLVPGLAVGQTYNFKVRDEVGKIWAAPTVPVAPFAAKMVRMSLEGVTLSFNSLPDRKYAIQWTPRLGAPWRTVKNVISQGGHTSVVVPHPAKGARSGFFRIQLK